MPPRYHGAGTRHAAHARAAQSSSTSIRCQSWSSRSAPWREEIVTGSGAGGGWIRRHGAATVITGGRGIVAGFGPPLQHASTSPSSIAARGHLVENVIESICPAFLGCDRRDERGDRRRVDRDPSCLVGVGHPRVGRAPLRGPELERQDQQHDRDHRDRAGATEDRGRHGAFTTPATVNSRGAITWVRAPSRPTTTSSQ